MLYDVGYLWLWLILALILGAGVGWRAEAPGDPGPWFVGWFRYAVIALAVAVVVAVLHLLSGRVAFWVETAALFFIAYVLGALAGGALKRTRAA